MERFVQNLLDHQSATRRPRVNTTGKPHYLRQSSFELQNRKPVPSRRGSSDLIEEQACFLGEQDTDDEQDGENQVAIVSESTLSDTSVTDLSTSGFSDQGSEDKPDYQLLEFEEDGAQKANQKIQMRCVVFNDIKLPSKIRGTRVFPLHIDHEKLEIEFYVVYPLKEYEKWSDVLQSFPQDMVKNGNLVGFIFINFQDNLILSREFFGGEMLHDTFVCMVSHSQYHRVMSTIGDGARPIRVRTVSAFMDSHPHQVSDTLQKDLMLSLDDYFSQVDCQGVNSEMYTLIFSFFDQRFKFKNLSSQKSDLLVVNKHLKRTEFQLPHFLLHASLVYLMNRHDYGHKNQLTKLVQSCTRRLFRCLYYELAERSQDIVDIVNSHLLYDDRKVMDEDTEKPFFQLLGDVCKDMLRVQFNNPCFGLKIMWISLYKVFMLHHGVAVENLKTTDLDVSAFRHFQKAKLLPIESASIIHALDLGQCLKLPDTLQVKGDKLGVVITEFWEVSSLKDIQDVFEVLGPYLQAHPDFFISFFLTVTCREVICLNIDAVNEPEQKRPLSILPMEGADFIRSLTKLVLMANDSHDELSRPLMSWWDCIVKAILFEHPRDTVLFFNSISEHIGGVGPVCEVILADFHSHFKTILEDSLPSMGLDTFSTYFSGIKEEQFPRKFVRVFLKSFQEKLPVGGQMLSSTEFTDILTVYNSRWHRRLPIEDQQCFCDFALVAGDKYEEDQKLDFIRDLLKLKHFPLNLSSAIDEGVYKSFCAGLQKFVIVNKLKSDICGLLVEANLLKHGQHSNLQEIVCRVIAEVVLDCINSSAFCQFAINSTPEFDCVTSAYTNILKYYKADPVKLMSPPSYPLDWCWRILLKMCSLLKPERDNLKWCKGSEQAINDLSWVYILKAECGIKILQNIPDSVVQHHYFQWISEIQNFFHHWKKQIHDRACSVAELKEYRQTLQEFGIEVFELLEITDCFLKEEFLIELIAIGEKLPGNIIDLLLINNSFSMLGILFNYKVVIPPKLEELVRDSLTDVQCFMSSPVMEMCMMEEAKWFNPNLSINLLECLRLELEQFLQPLMPNQKFLIYFLEKKSQLFQVFYDKAKALYYSQATVSPGIEDLSQSSDARDRFDFGPSIENDSYRTPSILLEPCEEEGLLPIEKFCHILSATEKSLKDLLTGKATYKDLKDLGILDGIGSSDLKKQFQLVVDYNFPDFDKGTVTDMGGIQDILEFQRLSDFVNLFCKICTDYGLHKCWKDQKMEEIKRVLLNSDEMAQLTPEDASGRNEKIKKVLGLTEQNTQRKCEQLFHAVDERKSGAFIKFLREWQFTGTQGRHLFQRNMQLITTNLRDDEYKEEILLNLSIAYEFISPFIDIDIELQEFIDQVHTVCYRGQPTLDPFHQLTLVNENIDLIYLWFTRTEDDPLKELKNILEFGYFEFVLQEAPESQAGILLKIPPMNTSANISISLRPSGRNSEMLWRKETVDDFIRRLGLLQHDEDVVKFITLSKLAQKVYNMKCHLMEHGIEEGNNILRCNCSIKETEDEVERLHQEVRKCQEKLRSLNEGCPNLLLLSIRKIQRLHSVLRDMKFGDKDEWISRVAKELPFLKDMATLGESLEINHESDPEEKPSNRTLFEDVKQVVRNCVPMDEVRPMFQASRCTLHLAADLPPIEILHLVLTIHGAQSMPWQIMYCTASTTKHELKWFFERVKVFKGVTFTLLNVNLLKVIVQEELVNLHNSLVTQEKDSKYQLHYVATGPTVLQDLPEVIEIDYKNGKRDNSEGSLAFRHEFLQQSIRVKIIHGKAGNGKTHYIQEKMQKENIKECCVITVNESFSPKWAIQKLNGLRMMPNTAIHVNFTLLPPVESLDVNLQDHDRDTHEKDIATYKRIANEVEWFFFNLFYLKYVEDNDSGVSFCLPSDMSWTVYIEVPSDGSEGDHNLVAFYDMFPILWLLGKPHLVHSEREYNVDADVQIVCKYLKAYQNRDGKNGIDRLLKKSTKSSKLVKPIKFGHLPDLPEVECYKCLYAEEHMPRHVRRSKLQQKLFIGYMTRRCRFMEDFNQFNYNSAYPKLGSTVLRCMLKEVSDFCDIERRRDWKNSTRQQLVYKCSDEGNRSLHIIAVNLNAIKEDLAQYEKLHIYPPGALEIHDRNHLDKYLSAALNIELDRSTKRIKAIDQEQYVLTLDYFLKMLEIHERMVSGVPVIIEGETGVGKTALLKMLSILWNTSIMEKITHFIGEVRVRMQEFFEAYEKELPGNIIQSFQKVLPRMQLKQADGRVDRVSYQSMQLKQADDRVDRVSYQSMLIVCQSIFYVASKPDGRKPLRDYLSTIPENEFAFILLDCKNVWTEIQDELNGEYPHVLSFNQFVRECFLEAILVTPRDAAVLLCCILRAGPLKIFHKLNVHAALSPEDIDKFLTPIVEDARRMDETWKLVATHGQLKEKIPKVTLFLDEVNSSSCLGLLKEIIVDCTFQGSPLPENLFVIAACNPHRGNSVVLNENKKLSDLWIRGTYYVHRLHPTMQSLKWDYGALSEEQEYLYVEEKMNMIKRETYDSTLKRDMDILPVGYFSSLITESQKCLRKYAEDHLFYTHAISREKAKELSYSCVSQRDIQRVFVFLKWLMKCYDSEGFKDRFPEDMPRKEKFKKAVIVSLALVYYVRLDEKPSVTRTWGPKNKSYREHYVVDLSKTGEQLKVDEVLKEELIFYCKHLSIPRGIAKTTALLENIFCIIACCCNRIPLIISGAPGSSKTLSFSLALDNIKGRQSSVELFRDAELFPSLDPCYYQCSKQTTSSEVESVFQRAIKKQTGFNQAKIPINCVVFMDEAGLPEESFESLKVLHKYLDNPEVAFVAITNHILDAAKTNRAVSLFRSRYVKKDLQVLMQGFLPNKSEMAVKLCEPYVDLMERPDFEDFSTFFGLRDLIHLGQYLRRNILHVNPQLVLQAFERNFNGYKQYHETCQIFLKAIGSSLEELEQRTVIDVIKDSLSDRPFRAHSTEGAALDEVRYKLVIDKSEDESVVRLLFGFNILDPSKTRIFMCSHFPEDSDVQMINTIVGIRHAIENGYTIIMSQTEEIHGSFYDVFNQYYKVIENPKTKEKKFFANIAIGSNIKPCHVHRDFQCIVIIKQSDVKTTPSPFLNRFEKYLISQKDFLEARLSMLPPHLKLMIEAAWNKVDDFFKQFGISSFYGAMKEETVDSLLLSILPSCNFDFSQDLSEVTESKEDDSTNVFESIIQTLQLRTGLRFPMDNYKQYTWGINTQDVTGQAFISDQYSAQERCVHINQAVDYLLSQRSIQVSSEAEFVISVMAQWIVLYLCRRLLNLMTMEGFVFGQKIMPSWCLDTYLSDQSHFTLIDTIFLYYKELQDKSLSTPVNKVVCSTHSSEIRGLPSWLGLHETRSGPEVVTERVTADDLKKIQWLKMSAMVSEAVFKKLLRAFLVNKEKEIVVMIVDMQETSNKVVNQVRILIDEMERDHVHEDTQKLFILLLHFPFSSYHAPCYPSVFSIGWDHCYLDTVLPLSFNISQFFSKAIEEDCNGTMHKQIVDDLKKDAIAVIATRVVIGSTNGGGFNYLCGSQDEKIQRISRLLNGPLGEKLCSMYISCWKQPELAHCLKEAALYTKSTIASLSVSKVVEEDYKNTFYNFISFMINLINTNLNIDVYFDCEDPPVRDLFLQIMDVLHIPKVAEIRAYNNTFDSRRIDAVKPCFPFFWKVCAAMDNLVEECINDILKERDAVELGGPVKGDHSYRQTISRAEDMLVARMNAASSKLLNPVVNALTHFPLLWEKYKENFIASKYQITSQGNPIAFDFIHKRLSSSVESSTEGMKQQLARLHFTTIVSPLDLGRLSLTILEPLQAYLEDSKYSETNIGHSVVLTLFEMLSTSIDDTMEIEEKVEKLATWQSLGLKLITQPLFKQFMCQAKKFAVADASRLNIMTALFLLSQSKWSKADTDRVNSFFLSLRELLLDRYSQKGSQRRVELPDIIECVVEVIEQQSLAANGDSEDKQIRLLFNFANFLETLLTFFFNTQSPYSEVNVEWFLRDINGSTDPNMIGTQRMPSLLNGPDQYILPKSFIVHLLREILSRNLSGSPMSPPFEVFNSETRFLVGRVLSERFTPETVPSSYLPPVYREMATSSSRSNSDDCRALLLADVYFVCFMEHIRTLQAMTMNFNLIVQAIEYCQQHIDGIAAEDVSEWYLSQIELQAVTQIALDLFAYELSLQYSEQTTRIPTVHQSFKSVIMSDESGSHRKMLNVLLQKHLGSPQSLKEFLLSRTAKDIEVLEPLGTGTAAPEPPPDFFPFMLPESTDRVAEVYKSVSKGIHDCKPVKLEKELHKLHGSPESFTDEHGFEYDKISFLKMVVWLVTYYEVYSRKKKYQVLADAFDKQEFLAFIDFTSQQRCMLKCFLGGTLEEVPETPKPDEIGAETKHKKDPLYELFTAVSSRSKDTQMCNAVANVVAVAFSLPFQKSHLWSFLFEQNLLMNSYLPGFMYNMPVSQRRRYSSGIELTEDGDFARPEYIYTTTGLTHHSFYLMLFVNIGALSVALLTQKSAQDMIQDAVIPRTPRHFCARYLRLLWKGLLVCVDGNTYLRPHFVMQCLHKFFKISQDKEKYLEHRFTDSDTVREYEQFWHSEIYCKVKNVLELKFEKQSALMREEAFVDLRNLGRRCIQFPSLSRMKHDLIEYMGMKRCCVTNLLLKFLDNYRRLSVGSVLLPQLVRFYTWLDTHLSHLLTKDQAKKRTIEEVLKLAAKHYHDSENPITNQFEAMKAKFNEYIQLSGGHIIDDLDVVSSIDSNTKVICFLFTEDSNGWLCSVISSIVKLHNSFFDCDEEGGGFLSDWMPKSEYMGSTCTVSHFDQKSAIIWEQDLDHLDKVVTNLFHSRYSFSHSASCSGRTYQWEELECDIVRKYVAGKPRLLFELESDQVMEVGRVVRKKFKFRTTATVGDSKSNNGVTSAGHQMDLTAITQELDPMYKAKWKDERERNQFESIFHNLDYSTLCEVMQGLRNAIGLLIEHTLNVKYIVHTDKLKTLLTDTSAEHPLKEIGIESCSEVQKHVLLHLQVNKLHWILLRLIEFRDTCYYTFCELPYALKSHPPHYTESHLMQELSKRSMDRETSSLDLVEDLEKALLHFVTRGLQNLNQQLSFDEEIKMYLIKYQLCDGESAGIVPSYIKMKHIVHFVILLRRLKIQLENDSSQAVQYMSGTKWNEDVSHSLQHSLPNLTPISVTFSKSQPLLHKVFSSSKSLIDHVTIWVDQEIEQEKDTLSDAEPEDCTSWTTTQVTKWLNHIGLGQFEFVKRFESEEVDGMALSMCSEESLQDLGVEKKWHRVKILTKWKKLSGTSDLPPSKVSEMTTAEVVEWLASAGCGKYAELFQEQDMDGDMLMQCDEECLVDLGIVGDWDRKKILSKWKSKCKILQN